jgi:hypothetical protein
MVDRYSANASLGSLQHKLNEALKNVEHLKTQIEAEPIQPTFEQLTRLAGQWTRQGRRWDIDPDASKRGTPEMVAGARERAARLRQWAECVYDAEELLRPPE